MLEVRDIHTYYGKSHILQGVSLKVEQGSIVAILGRNGVGKTTLIHSVLGFAAPSRGQVLFKGIDITGFPPHRIIQMGIGWVPQGKRIFSLLSVEENVKLGARQRGRNWDLERVYSLFPVLRSRRHREGSKLSGGEQQLVAVARALMTEPDLLVMDEPSEGLAPLLVKELGEVIRQIKEEGVSILLVEQNLSFALRVADYVYVMSTGAIVFDSPPQELWLNEGIKASYLGV